VLLPDFPSLVAVISDVPAATAVTRPPEFTVAELVLPLVHVIARPVSVFPLASRSVAVSCSVPPAWILGFVGETATVDTGAGTAAVTVIEAVPLLPSLVAVIVAFPALTAATVPVDDTVATAVLLLDHAMLRPGSGFPLASYVVAVSARESPATRLALDGLTLTDDTGTGGEALTVTIASPVVPSLAALIVAVPGAMPVTNPDGPTAATAVLEVPHAMMRPLRVAPLASFAVAVAWAVWPV
jgi:hypothetical protein